MMVLQMRIPTEHFAHVPVVLLSPSLLPSPEEEAQSSFPRSLMSRLVGPEHTVRIALTLSIHPVIPVFFLEGRINFDLKKIQVTFFLKTCIGFNSFIITSLFYLVITFQSLVENSVGSAPNSPTSSRRFASLSAHSAPGSRGGSALGFSDALSVPPNCMSRSVDTNATPPATLDRRYVV